MKVPLSWLREFVDVPVEPARLAEDLSLAGLAVDGLESHDGDVVLDLDITTNRVDCMNVYGVAREVSVRYGRPLRPLETEFAESGPPAGQGLEVAVEASDLCPRFCARVLDVRVGPSPGWLRERLEKVGVRPINSVVDLTNYVMMEMGHPSHAFDLDRVPGAHLRVRWAREGERVRTLDGVERTLARSIGVVAGAEGALALAGIMGGASSEVGEQTRTVALEAAYWDPLSIRRAARALAMRTEASHRFERGADPEGAPLATARIAHLLGRTGGGSVRPGLIDRHVAPRPARTALFRPARAQSLLGAAVPPARADAVLSGLGFRLREVAEGLEAGIPSWRGDVTREVDLVEEVARHHGLDRLPSTLPPGRGAEGLRPWQQRMREVREALVGAGLVEVVTYAFVSDRAAGPHVPARLPLHNPLSDDQGVLRSALVSPGLLGVLQGNLRRGRRGVRVFELGRVFLEPEHGEEMGWPVREIQRLGILLAGPPEPPRWSLPGAAADFYDLKGVLEVLGQRLGVSLEFRGDSDPPPLHHPGRSARVWCDGRQLGAAGAVHPDVASAWELRDEAVVAELDLTPLLQPRPAARFQSLARFPAVERDLSVLVASGTAAAELEERVREAAGPHLLAVHVVDRYEGPPLAAGTFSLTLRLVYQAPARTLTGEEVQSSVSRVIGNLRGAGLEIRGEGA